MDNSEFLEKMMDVFQMNEGLTMDTILADVDAWDSLAMISIMALYKSEYKISIHIEDIRKAETVKDLFALGR